MIQNPESMKSLREKALIEFKKFPQAKFMEELLETSR
jgi:hypothetical protein